METVMSERIRRRALLPLATALAVVGAFAVSAAGASAAEVVYSNVPNTLGPNYASVGPEAYAYHEFGGQLELAGTARNKPTVEVVMSTWGCQFGQWSIKGSCETPLPKKKFKWPLTLNVYEVGEKNAVGEKLGSITKTFSMPYRPSDDVTNCPSGEQWYEPTKKECFHGFAFKLKFPTLKVLRLPKHVIFGISYNTSHYGPAPVGQAAPCYTKSAGCYYDSLNVGLEETGENLLTVGMDPAEAYVQSTSSEMTCGNTALETSFGETTCLPGYQPLFKVTAH
jgi:hypothetical protein